MARKDIYKFHLSVKIVNGKKYQYLQLIHRWRQYPWGKFDGCRVDTLFDPVKNPELLRDLVSSLDIVLPGCLVKDEKQPGVKYACRFCPF